jgi:hypothetical protein
MPSWDDARANLMIDFEEGYMPANKSGHDFLAMDRQSYDEALRLTHRLEALGCPPPNSAGQALFDEHVEFAWHFEDVNPPREIKLETTFGLDVVGDKASFVPNWRVAPTKSISQQTKTVDVTDAPAIYRELVETERGPTLGPGLTLADFLKDEPSFLDRIREQRRTSPTPPSPSASPSADQQPARPPGSTPDA